MTSLFSMRCGIKGCHGPGESEGQVDLASANVEERLIGVDSKTMKCEGRALVATDGGDSLLLQKVSGSQPPCGMPMPYGGKLSTDELKCVTDWVNTVSKAKRGGS